MSTLWGQGQSGVGGVIPENANDEGTGSVWCVSDVHAAVVSVRATQTIAAARTRSVRFAGLARLIKEALSLGLAKFIVLLREHRDSRPLSSGYSCRVASCGVSVLSQLVMSRGCVGGNSIEAGSTDPERELSSSLDMWESVRRLRIDTVATGLSEEVLG